MSVGSGTHEMADDAPMSVKHHYRETTEDIPLALVAREELSMTARAFFAPLVGTFHIIRSLLSEDVERPEPPKKPRVA